MTLGWEAALLHEAVQDPGIFFVHPPSSKEVVCSN